MISAAPQGAIFPNRAGLSGYVADIGAGIVCSELGLPAELHDSHASYVDHWLKVLKADSSAIIHAASKAEQAWRWLSGFSRAPEEQQAEAPIQAAAA